MFLPLALWHPHNLILKNTLHLVLLSASFQKLKFLSLEANNFMKNNWELCYTFSTSGMRVSYAKRFLFMNIHGNKYWGQIGFGFQCDFLLNAYKGIFFWGSFFSVMHTFKMKKIQYYFYKWIYAEGDLHISVPFCTLLDIFITNHGCLYYWNPLRMESECCLKMLKRENVQIV